MVTMPGSFRTNYQTKINFSYKKYPIEKFYADRTVKFPYFMTISEFTTRVLNTGKHSLKSFKLF